MPLVVNGFTIGVHLNCWYALWQLRNAAVEFPLWIDTIAIDQANHSEKSVQVARMGEIYSQAQSVASCIGMGNFLNSFATDYSRSQDDDLIWEELAKLPYWYRAWIRQEVIRAREIYVYCGRVSVPWNELAVLCRRVREQRKADTEVTNLMDQRTSYHAGPSGRGMLDSARLMRQFGNLQCADPKDKIYALMSLIPKNDPLSAAIVPNYGLPMFNFFLELMSLLTKSEFFRMDKNPMELLLRLVEWLQIDPTSVEVVQFLKSGWGTTHTNYAS